MDMNLLREWVIAEIEYALAQRVEDENGYRSSAYGDRDVAQMAFDKLCAAQQSARTGLRYCKHCPANSEDTHYRKCPNNPANRQRVPLGGRLNRKKVIVDFFNWQKKWQKENPRATLYEAQLDAYLAGREAAQRDVQLNALPCGHDPNNLRLGNDGIYGCAECLATNSISAERRK